MGTKCTLRIRAPGVEVSLEGDAALVRAGYEGIRQELLRQLRIDTEDTVPQAYLDPLAPDETVADAAPVVEAHGEYVWVFKTNDLYNKVYVVERARLYATGLGQFVRPGAIKRIYVESEHSDFVERLIPPGRTLWSELTKLGRERLRRE